MTCEPGRHYVNLTVADSPEDRPDDELFDASCPECGDSMSPADAVYLLQGRLSMAETSTTDRIDRILKHKAEHWAFDYYDRSVELYYNNKFKPTREQCKAMGALGFALFWIHDHPDGNRQRPDGSMCKCPCWGTRYRP